MELGAGPDLEIRSQEHAILAHRHAALAPVDGIALVGVDEGAFGRDARSPVGFDELLGGRRRREHKRKQEQAERHAEAGAQHGSSQQKGD